MSKQAIVWQSRVRKIERFEFVGKDDARERLQSVFGVSDGNASHFDVATDHGYCIAYKVNSLVRINVPKPSHYSFPKSGWLRSSDEEAPHWLNAKVYDDLLSRHQRHRNPYIASWLNPMVFDDLRSAVETYEKSGNEFHCDAAYAKLQEIPDNSITAKHTDEMVWRLGKARVKHGRRAAKGGANKPATAKPTTRPEPKPTPGTPEHPDGPAAKGRDRPFALRSLTIQRDLFALNTMLNEVGPVPVEIERTELKHCRCAF